jgi:UPF0042 nucleotide-binding protein
MAATLISFGYLHSEPPTGAVIFDVRNTLRDPAAARNILELDGRDPVVQQVVMATPGARDVLDRLVAVATHGPVAVGCAGGRHRSVALVEMAASRIRDEGGEATVRHLHVHLPRVVHYAALNGT